VTVRHICVLSGKRGGFGALAPMMREIMARPDMRLSVLVTDQHLYERFGKTIAEVEAAFPIAAAIDMEQKGDRGSDRARAVGVCLSKMADTLDELRPDILVVIGDRGEVLATTIAAHNLNVPVAHIQGGDISGTLDEPVRHAITKLSHLHFPSTARSADRIRKLGEEEWRIHTVGDTHVDQILQGTATPYSILRERYDLAAGEPFILVLQHPDTTEPQESGRHMRETVGAVLSFGVRTLLVYPCSDQGFEGIVGEIEGVRGIEGVSIHPNIPAPDFIGLQMAASCLVGNSSAGLIEAPYFGLPAINVGDRQKGREHDGNVIHVPYERTRIREAISRALDDTAWRSELKTRTPPFGDGNACHRITEMLGAVELGPRLFNKRMTY
jgi:UDP-N-acetylglucosamine 2-epimerase (non-hydrolysing)/GDP/UDP-N,N'-diacetylbacillosamine 2-epimerase (hydrolysing)